jgi:hypothetical protein
MKYVHLKRTDVKSCDTKDVPDIYEDLRRVMNCVTMLRNETKENYKSVKCSTLERIRNACKMLEGLCVLCA